MITEQARPKSRVRLAARDEKDRPIWHAVRGKSVATGSNPVKALENLVLVLPTRRKV